MERANFQNSYLMRYVVMAAILLGAGLWFGYDGFIAWPRGLPAAKAYDELRDIRDADLRMERWQTLVEKNGWPASTPEQTAEELQGKIRGQYFYMALCFLGGIPALLYYFGSRGCWIETTEDGFTTSWGQQVKFSDVKLLNKKRWAKKGIAVASYDQAGVTKKLVLDDFKYEREPLGRMLRTLESQLAREQIIGGPTELETDAQRQAEQQASAVEEADESASND